MPFSGAALTRQKTRRYNDGLKTTGWVDLLGDREREALSSKPAVVGVAELSQSEKREHGFHARACPCITPGGIYMVLDRLRLLVPYERLALQGILVPPSIYAVFSRDFWTSLAGNSFCAPVLAAIYIALLLVHARRRCASAPPAPVDAAVADTAESLMCEALSCVDLASELCGDLLSEVSPDELWSDRAS